jgi:hypothetical protein
MPLTYLSHQAVVLPLKLASPRTMNGTALVLGSIAPDVEYYFRGYAIGTIGHTWPGQITFCLPVTLGLYWLVTRVIAVPLAAHLPAGGMFRLHDYALIARQLTGIRHWIVVCASALVGSSSHVLLDRFTGGWSTKYQSAGSWPPPDLLPSDAAWAIVQFAIWIGLGAVTIVLLGRIGQQRLLRRWASIDDRSPGELEPEVRSRPFAFWFPIGLISLIGGTLATLFRKPGYHLHEYSTWIHIALCAGSGAFIGLVISSLWALQFSRNRTR